LVAEAMVEFAGADEAWRDAVRFRSGGYTRHLLHRSPRFEVLLLCWDQGLESDLHDHAGQRCWMTALDGEIEEVRFVRDDPGAVHLEGVRLLDRARPAFIRDELGLHVVRARPSSQAVSLHLYAKPVERCGIYCDRTGARLASRELAYDSAGPGAFGA
jgi:cysteine dioxygenase